MALSRVTEVLNRQNRALKTPVSECIVVKFPNSVLDRFVNDIGAGV
jgi:hypothetical protein